MAYVEESHDALIVGGGGAGLRAAIQLSEAGHQVAVISKVFPTRSHTVAAQGGINAALGNADGHDDWRWHMYDTIMGSDFMGDQDAIEYMCKHAPQSIIELEHMGMPFSRDENGKIYQRAFGGQTREYGKKSVHRTCAAADRTGHAMLHTLFQQNVAHKTKFYHEWYVIDLLFSDQQEIAGVIALCIETGEIRLLRSRFTLLATGGAGRIYQSTTNAYTCTGDGLGMVARAGLALQDMEMWQFHPTGIAGAGVLVTEGCRGEGGFLVNREGERYMERYSPHMKDLACRDVVSRSSMIEIREGRGCGPNQDHVFLKLEHLGEKVLQKRLPGITEISKTFANVDPAKQPIPVVPTCHYLMGGIPTTRLGEVIKVIDQKDHIVPRLFAAGECACVSVHGANRLGANSLLDLVVFGRACGIQIHQHLQQGASLPNIDKDRLEKVISRMETMNTRKKGISVSQVRSKMQTIMQQDFGVFRTGDTMASGLQKLKDLVAQHEQETILSDHSQVFNTARVEAYELDNLLSVALSTAYSAFERKESRGAHARMDFPDRDDEKWHCHSIYLEGKIGKRPVNMKPLETDSVPLQAREG
ncbi:succinate dehydrogenase flavoprotein subunit [Gammaproteobacteria bacterium]|nr:succinate dehydrogenase flavoprotein subunit [Gammaproteobacteria bacterium]